MAESAVTNASKALYQYVCQNIVGSEEQVKTLRLMHNVRDHLKSHKYGKLITSGSFGEGLNMRGSDIDVMAIFKQIEICEDKHVNFNFDKIYFTMELKDTQPGFTKLRLVYSNYCSILKACKEIGSDFYFSNLSFKQRFSNKSFPIVHGPCLTDESGLLDFAVCLHSKSWITPAKQWITRSNNAWPSCDVKNDIIRHGVLFVPIGVKGSTQEELEWRISFSVGEKLLIYSFTHTQLLCYALMKILLKDVIASDISCNEMLCSYFLKTILFWMCEELFISKWKPENLISCFMRCFRRLIYCVEYRVCPHYFIPENNLFENKIQGQAQKILLNNLYILNSYGWKCILLSDQISNLNGFAFDISKEISYSDANRVERLSNSNMFFIDNMHSTFDFLFEKMLCSIFSCKSSKIKYLYIYYFSKLYCSSGRFLPLEDISGNTPTYKQYTTCISTLLLNTHHDAVSGWLLLASYFYRRKQYNAALHIIQYSLLKCTPEKFHRFMQLSDIHYQLFNLHLYRNMPIVRLWKLFLLDIVFIVNSKLLPNELQMEEHMMIPPVVYAHFLRFLCYYHLKNSRQCWDSLRDLQLTIEGNYFIAEQVLEGLSYIMLGIGFQLIGEIEAAIQAFRRSIELFPNEKHNIAFRNLSLIS